MVKKGFMCKTDFEMELGKTNGGVIIYPTEKDCKNRRDCIDQCGMVEVEIRVVRNITENKEKK